MLHPRYKKKTDYCCCTGTVHCNYCVGQGKPPHLTVDKDFNTILMADKDYSLKALARSVILDYEAYDFSKKAYTKEEINELHEILKEPKMNSISTQNEAISAIKSQFYIVGSVDSSGNVSFSDNPVLQGSVASARAECKRLASITPGKMYVFVKFCGAELVPNNTISI